MFPLLPQNIFGVHAQISVNVFNWANSANKSSLQGIWCALKGYNYIHNTPQFL
jgi:hypothetical protein